MRNNILTALAFIFLTSPVGFGAQPAHAQGNTSTNTRITLDIVTNTVRNLCLHPKQQGEYVKVEGSVDAGVLIKLAGINVVGKATAEKWTGVQEALTNTTIRTHVRCTQSVLPILLNAFGLPHFGCKNIRTAGFGGFGGRQFDSVEPQTLQLRSGDYVDAIILNGTRYGGQGGQAGGSFRLEAGEFITSAVIRSGQFVDRLVLTTNHGRALVGGGGGGAESTMDNIRVLRIGGRSGAYLDRIELTYCELH